MSNDTIRVEITENSIAILIENNDEEVFYIFMCTKTPNTEFLIISFFSDG